MSKEANLELINLSDNDLIERFRYSHDNLYLGELYGRYAHLVLGLCIKYFKDVELAKDATMNIFELLILELKRHQIHNFKSWLYTVSKNYCLQELRKQQSIDKNERNYKVFLQETVENDTDLHLYNDKEKLLIELENEIPNLKHNQKMCIKMFYLDGKSYADISKELNLSLKDVKSHIQNGKRNLKIKLLEKNVRK